ncbi:MAG TPA: FKBP-type peptidyl-prolyl cis-trans isomerase [Gammaproteobacteria bacterium]|nr:FKBP-type peptidyl-prolyl cis-trans isomerase [Gammaproteobacteria bacterium]
MRHSLLSIALLALVACSPTESTAPAASAQSADLTTDQDKTLYAIGLVLGQQINDFKLTGGEFDIVSLGMKDAVLGLEPKAALDEYGPRIQQLLQERMQAVVSAEKQASDAWVAEQAALPGAQRSASGIVVIPMTEGTGANPTADSTVRVHYHGTLRDGTVFDSSVQRGEPISFALNMVISCWTEGVQKIKVGGKSKLICPSDTAYGDRGQGDIKPGAALAFEVELLAIE